MVTQNKPRRKHHNSLTFEHRVQLLDWLRAIPSEDLKEKRLDEKRFLTEAEAVTGKPCNIAQLKNIAVAGGIEWPMLNGRVIASNAAQVQQLEQEIRELRSRIAFIEEALTNSTSVDNEIPDI